MKGNLGYLWDQYWDEVLPIRQSLSTRLEFSLYSDFLGFMPGSLRTPSEVRGPVICSFDWFNLQQREFERQFNMGSRVSPYCILEPLKARIITKPGVGQYETMTTLQKEGHRTLANHSSGVFLPTIQTLEKEHLARLLGAWDTGMFFKSGDFSGATDRLSVEAARRMFKVLYGHSRHIPQYLKGLAMLTNSTVHYSDKCLPNLGTPGTKENPHKWPQASGHLGDTSLLDDLDFGDAIVAQTNGQLMGDPLSFPLLCLWNAANFFNCWLEYNHWYEGEEKMTPALFNLCAERTGLLICGDDIAFTGTLEFITLWNRSVAEFGMELSPGKDFASDRFVQFCSQTYYVETIIDDFQVGRAIGAHLIPYVNFGWLLCRKKQDCSRDISNTGVVSMSGREQLDPAFLRFAHLDKLIEEQFTSLPDEVARPLLTHYQKYWRVFVQRFRRLDWSLIGLPRKGGSLPFSESLKLLFTDQSWSKGWTHVREVCSMHHQPEYRPFNRYRTLLRRAGF